jgi:hypothetical protein
MQQCESTRAACAKRCEGGDTMVCLGLGLLWAKSTHRTGSGPSGWSAQRRNALATARMREHIQAITSESYCPAKLEFIAAAGLREFGARSKKHCDESPPSATGLSGSEVELKAECAAVHATPCRAP